MSSLISSSLEDNLSSLQQTFSACDDIVFHRIMVGDQTGYVVHLSELTDQEALFNWERAGFPLRMAKEATSFQTAADNILSGCPVLFMEGADCAYAFAFRRSAGRSVSEPATEPAVKGPKEAFVEDIHTNVRLIRQKIRSSSLKVEHMTLGTETNTQVSIMYIKDVANENIVQEVRRRLSNLDIASVLDSHYVESRIGDAPMSPFPTLFSTERPDRVCGGLLNGKVAILTDGSPFALTAPALFVEFLHAGDDYYQSALVSSIIRWVRFLGLFVALILPAFYVAMITIHQDLLQTPLLIRIAAHREALPYPALVEALFLLLTFELLREAALRMPRVFGGGTVTLLGLVIIGQGAVQAGIIGPVMAIVISTTALASFLLPSYAFYHVIRFIGIVLLILGGCFGFMGIIVGLMFGLAHLVSLRSFGVPYLSPVSPARKERWKDVFLRAPWWAMETGAPMVDKEGEYGEK
jgi:hypothetical protein